MKKMLSLTISFLLVLGMIAPVLASGQFDHILTTADVEKATGLTGVKQVPREPLNKFRNGDLNFVLRDGTPVLMIQFRPSFVFDAMKSDSGYFKSPLTGIGEEAFTSPAFDPQFSINLHKGHYVSVVTTNVDPRDKTRTVINMDKLIVIAKIVASRM